jgi:N-acetylglutamate synthase-like GNAT family acetyltransferase
MLIRSAQIDDLSKIFEIYTSSTLKRDLLYDRGYRYRIQKSGFLLGLDTKESLGLLIDDAHFFLVAEDENEIQGYLIADHNDKFIDDEYKTWFDPEIKELYYNSNNVMSVHTLAVHPSYKGKGVASHLISNLVLKLKEEGIKYLFSIVTLGPLTNCASLLFHTKRGLKRLAMGSPRTLFDLENYSSVLMYKELEVH